MAITPFELNIRRLDQQSGTETVLCGRSLRAIPNNREVLEGRWNDKDVVIKVFWRRFGASGRMKREWDGLNLLRSRGVNAPRGLFYGETQDGRWAVASEKVADAISLMEVYRNCADKDERIKLLSMVPRELASQHEKGIEQKDLHLGNFLLKGDRLVVLDPGQMRFSNRPTGRRKSISQLALLTSTFRSEDGDCATRVWREYFKERGWEFTETDERLLQKQAEADKRAGIKKGLKKCLRTSRSFLRIRTTRYLAIFDKEFCAGVEPCSPDYQARRGGPIDFLNRIDELMEKGKSLKHGDTSCVSRLTWNGKDIVIKRYNHKGFFHSLRHTIKGSRARQSWLHGHRLLWLGIPTPKPLAYIEHRKGPILWKSYLVTQYVDGQNLHYFLRDKTVSEEKRSTIVRQILELLEKLHKNGLTHRDLKPSNILVTAEGPVLTDLDAMKAHKLGWICALKGRGYLERFKKSVNEGPV